MGQIEDFKICKFILLHIFNSRTLLSVIKIFNIFRSAVLAQNGDDMAALRDIGRALSTQKYPKHLQVIKFVFNSFEC